MRGGGIGHVTKGFGRFATIPEIGIVFMNSGAVAGKPGQQLIKAMLIMENYNPTPGLASWSPLIRVMITGLSQFQLGQDSLALPDFGNGPAD